MGQIPVSYRNGLGVGKGSNAMKKVSGYRVCLAAAMGLLMACSTTKKDVAQAPRSDDLLELLTGFGESLSKRNFEKAVDFMVPEEKALMMEGSSVPDEKQKMLLALRLSTLIRHPSIRVEDGHIAGIYSMLPNLRQGEASPMAMDAEGNGAESAEGDANTLTAESGPMAAMPDMPDAAVSEEGGSVAAAGDVNPDDQELKEAVNKFFAAVNKKNWSGALALMNDNEKKFLLDEKGRLKESSKQRLAQMDQKNKEALILQDGKLTGVTVLLPAD